MKKRLQINLLVVDDDREKCLEAGLDDYLSKARDTMPVEDIFDRADLLDRFMGNKEFANEIMNNFIEEVPHQITALREAMDNGDTDMVSYHAHNLKGAASIVSALALQETAAQIETAAEAGDLAKAGSFIQNVDEQFGILKIALV